MRATAPVGIGAVGNGCRCGEVSLGSLGFRGWRWSMGCSSMGWGLESRAFLTENPDTHVSRAARAKTPVVRDVVGAWLSLWGDCSQVSGALLGGGKAQDVPLWFSVQSPGPSH